MVSFVIFSLVLNPSPSSDGQSGGIIDRLARYLYVECSDVISTDTEYLYALSRLKTEVSRARHIPPSYSCIFV